MGVKPTCILAVFLLALMSNGCTDTPKVRMVGSPAPDFTVKDSDRTVSLHDFRGKLVVLNFWAAHCGPCIEEMPSLVQLQKNMGARVTVVGVGVDTSDNDYHRFLREYNINFLTVRDADKESYGLYGSTGYPETFIIDAAGTLRRKFIGPVDWTSQEITDYLNKL